MEEFDHVVIGAGIVGSSTAWQLAKKNRKVLLLEQFSLPHTRGSSHGSSRLIRSCYFEEHFASLMPDALSIWKQMEEEASTQLIEKTGLLCLESSRKVFDGICKNMAKYFPEKYEILSSGEVRCLYPLMKYSDGFNTLLDKTGGVILANKALTAVQDLFKKSGGVLRDAKPVHSVEINDCTVKVHLKDKRVIITPSLVVCAGAWTSEIFKVHHEDLSMRLKQYLQGTAVRVYYWKCKEGTDPGSFPTFIEGTEHSIYGLSPIEYPGMMKVCLHGGVPCNPDEREKAIFDSRSEESLKKYVEEHLPGLEPEPVIIEKCMYTTTPDENYILDYFYEHKNVILGCGFSGIGFKTAPIVGKILSEMALGEKPSHDVPEFKLSRFS